MSSGISSKPEQAGHGAPFLSFSTVFNNYFVPDSLVDKMHTSEQEQNTYSVKKGDIFLTRTSETLDELGMSCVAIKDFSKATFSGFVKRLRPLKTDFIYDKFMAFYLRSKLFRKTMTNNAIMTLRASLNEDIFSYLYLHLPDFNSQKKIGDFLFLLNTKFELNNRINTELEAMAKTIYDYWFVQFDFPDAKGKPYKTSGGKMVWNKELKQEIPEGWDSKNLNYFGDFKNGINYDPSIAGDTIANIINVRNISSSSLFIQKSTLDQICLQGENVQKYLVSNDDILIARSGIPGATRLMYEYNENTIYCGFIIRFRVSNPVYKNYLFFSIKNIEKASTAKSAGTIMQNINQESLNRLILIDPKDYLINKFNEFITPIFNKMNNINNENQQLTSLRDWLLPMLMNGQVKVKDAEEETLLMAAEEKVTYQNKTNS